MCLEAAKAGALNPDDDEEASGVDVAAAESSLEYLEKMRMNLPLSLKN